MNTLADVDTAPSVQSARPTQHANPGFGPTRHASLAPRYTSYPTADQFDAEFSARRYQRHIRRLRGGAYGPLSVYVHVPFCQSLCYYCACNKVIAPTRDRVEPYLQALLREIDLTAQCCGDAQPVVQMHWGGGTPTFLTDDEIDRVLKHLQGRFAYARHCELSIEVDPRTVDAGRVAALAQLGFNRLSLGIQDFDPAVQRAINRVQPSDMVADVLDAARVAGFSSTNFDLIYGLPNQTVEGFADTLDRVEAMRPERIALYSYAHLPERFKSQRLIRSVDMPTDAEKAALFDLARNRLAAAGYHHIGLDHFALPTDAIAVASAMGRLYRNFQGYSTRPECSVLGFGPSAISRVGGCYSQNAHSLKDYLDTTSFGELPVVRGIELTPDDLARRAVITAIMCQGYVDKRTVEIAHLITFDTYFAPELQAMRVLVECGWVNLDPDSIEVTACGRRDGLREVASVFDVYLADSRRPAGTERFLS